MEWVDSEDPLFVLYTSGSTGKPKGVLHTTGGYMVYAATTSKYIFDLQDKDVFFCTADCGWITGHSYVAYGPLLNGATQLVFEGVPSYPDAGRLWKMVDKYAVTQLYTAPTVRRTPPGEGPLPRLPRPSRPAPSARRDGGGAGDPRSDGGGRGAREGHLAQVAQAAGLGGRADQPRGVALVLQRGGRGPLPDRRHVVADGDGRHHDDAAARQGLADEAGLVHPPLLRHPGGDGCAVMGLAHLNGVRRILTTSRTM